MFKVQKSNINNDHMASKVQSEYYQASRILLCALNTKTMDLFTNYCIHFSYVYEYLNLHFHAKHLITIGELPNYVTHDETLGSTVHIGCKKKKKKKGYKSKDVFKDANIENPKAESLNFTVHHTAFNGNRRGLWLTTIIRAEWSEDLNKNARLCSSHFISGS